MPIYEYACEKCGKIEEALQKFSDKPLETCSHCSGRLHKLISQSSFHLKGTGWYVTDYAGKKSTRPDTTPKSDTPNKSDTTVKSDTTPEKKDTGPTATKAKPASPGASKPE